MNEELSVVTLENYLGNNGEKNLDNVLFTKELLMKAVKKKIMKMVLIIPFCGNCEKTSFTMHKHKPHSKDGLM